MKKNAFTTMELMVSMAMTVVIAGALVYVYLTCFRAWNASETRVRLRTELSQAMQLMIMELRKANKTATISVTDSGGRVTFKEGADASTQYNFFRNAEADGSFTLRWGKVGDPGAIIATGLQSPARGFSGPTANLMTIDFTAKKNDITIHMKTQVYPRN